MGGRARRDKRKEFRKQESERDGSGCQVSHDTRPTPADSRTVISLSIHPLYTNHTDCIVNTNTHMYCIYVCIIRPILYCQNVRSLQWLPSALRCCVCCCALATTIGRNASNLSSTHRKDTPDTLLVNSESILLLFLHIMSCQIWNFLQWKVKQTWRILLIQEKFQWLLSQYFARALSLGVSVFAKCQFKTPQIFSGSHSSRLVLINVILVLSPQYVCGWCMFLTVKWIFVDSITFSSPWEGLGSVWEGERLFSWERERGGDKKFDWYHFQDFHQSARGMLHTIFFSQPT